MVEKRLIGLFDRLDDAQAAKQDLLHLGVPQAQVKIGARSTEGYGLQTVTERQTRSGSSTISDFLSALKELFVREEDAQLLAEGVRRGGILLVVRLTADQAEQATEIFERHQAVDLNERGAAWRSQGWSRFDETAEPDTKADIAEEHARFTTPRTGTTPAPEDQQAIPVVQEELEVGKRQVRSGQVRVRSFVVETPVEEQVTLHEEHARIERRPVDRPVGADAFQEKTIEVTEAREEPVVNKTARITEEVVVGKSVETHTETVSATVRRTEVEIEDDRDHGTDSQPDPKPVK